MLNITVNGSAVTAAEVRPGLYDVRSRNGKPFTLQRVGDGWMMLRHTDRAQWQSALVNGLDESAS